MKTICLFFELHNFFHLKRYRFFDIGNDHYYYDDYANETSMDNLADKSFRPTIDALTEMATTHGKAFKVAVSVSGVCLEHLELHAPDVIDKLQKLEKTGCLELIAEPYSHGLSSLIDEEAFVDEVKRHVKKIKQIFGQTPKVLRNTNMMYSDDIGAVVASMGFKGMLTEGAKHILGWKSPHYLYHCNQNPNLKLLLRDYKLSDDISLRFSNPEWSAYPLYASTYADWIAAFPKEEEVFNIFMNMSAIGISQPLHSNIIDFLKAIPACAAERGITFSTPSEIIAKLKSSGQIDAPYPVSWADEERDVSSWLGNVMQKEAFSKLYSVSEKMRLTSNRVIKQDWDYLQASNHFRFMTTKNSGIGIDRGIYDSPYDAFTNYMNILGDFLRRIDALFPADIDSEELNSLITTIRNQSDEIEKLKKQIAAG